MISQSLKALFFRASTPTGPAPPPPPPAPPPPSGGSNVVLTVGQFVWFPMPAGQVGQIQVQRNGADIAGALSSAGVGAYQYKVTSADIGTLASPVYLTARVIGAAYETSAPRIYRSEILISAPTQILITFDESLDPTSVPVVSDFSLTGTFVTAKTLTTVTIAANLVTLTCSTAFVPGDAPLLSYTPGTNKLRDLANTPNNALAFTSMGIWNNYPPPAVGVTLLSSETNYTAGAGGFLNTNGGGFWAFVPTLASFSEYFADQNHPAVLNDEGWAEFQVSDTSSVVRMVGAYGQNALTYNPYEIQMSSGVVTAYNRSTSSGISYTFPTQTSLCRVRLKRAIPSGQFTMDTSEDGGITWATRYAWPTALTAQTVLFCFFTASTSVPILGAALEGFQDRGY